MILRIGHIDYLVRPLTEYDDGLVANWGETDHNACEIRLDCSQPSARQLETLIHEIIHAAWKEYGMPPRVNEERVASFAGNAFAALIRANDNLLPVLIALRNGGSFVGAR